MLEDNIVISKKEKQKFEPLPENIYQVELLDITAKLTDNYDRTGKENVLSFQFVLLDGEENEKSLRGRSIWRNYVPTYLYAGKRGKNVLYQIVEAFMGRVLTQEEEAKMSAKTLNFLIGKQCRIVVKNSLPNKDGAIFSNIQSFSKVSSQITPLTQEDKEKATVSVKEENNNTDSNINSDIDISKIPF